MNTILSNPITLQLFEPVSRGEQVNPVSLLQHANKSTFGGQYVIGRKIMKL
jgi:hypothetical protein